VLDIFLLRITRVGCQDSSYSKCRPPCSSGYDWKLLSFASWAMAVRPSRTWPMGYASIGNPSGRLSLCLIFISLLPEEKNGVDI